MDRGWMYGNRKTLEFFNGLQEFCKCAIEHQRSTKDDRFFCPCCDCNNMKRFRDIEIIKDHLIRRGFRQEYHVWLWHGEKAVSTSSSSEDDIQWEESESSSNEDSDVEEDPTNEMMDRVAENLNEPGKRRGRGPSRGVHVKEPMFLEYDDLGQPMGEWESQYAKHLGSCALKININIKKYRFVPECTKQIFWGETKALFHIVDGPKREKEKLFHSGVGARFRSFKSKLVSRWITKTRKPPKNSAHSMPWDVYKGFITKKDWKKFEAAHMTDEAKAVSERARKSSKQNKHHHHLGARSYKRSKEQWIKDGRYPIDSTGTSSSRIAKRGLDWVLARQEPGEGGTWVIRNDETRKVAKRYEDYMQQQIQGTFVPQRNMDALCMALGKKDHSNRVYGIGGLNVGHRKVFGKPDRKDLGLNKSRESMEEIKEAIKASLMEDFEQRLEDQVAVEVKRQWASMMQQPGGLRSPQGTSLLETTNSDPPPPVPKACRLAVWDAYSGDKVVVASGVAYPFGNGPIMPGHLKVILNDPYNEFCDIELPVPTEEGATKVGEAQGSLVQWPKALVLFEDEEATSKKKVCEEKNKDKFDSSDLKLEELEANVEGPLQQFGDDILASVGEASKLLHFLITSQPERYDVTTVQLDAKVLHLEKDVETFVTAEDIALLLKGERLNISIVQVFMMCLVDEYIPSLDVSHIGFLCPQTIAASNIIDHHQAITDYMKNVFLSSRDKGDAEYKLILAPYYQDEHWMLIVINLAWGEVFKFDSSMPKKGRSLAIKDSLDHAYSAYKAQGRKGRVWKPKWFSIKCAQQKSETECGYYVMKYMHEIVTMHSDCQNLEKEYKKRDEPYRDEEINEIRELWAIFFKNKYLIKSPE